MQVHVVILHENGEITLKDINNEKAPMKLETRGVQVNIFVLPLPIYLI